MKNCPICSSKSFKKVFKKNAHQVVKCQECQFGFLKDYPSLNEIKKIYNEKYFEDKKENFFLADAQKKYNFVKKYLKGNEKFLDYGCGLGDFISLLRKESFRAKGYDISPFVAKFTSEKYNIETSSSDLKRDLFEEQEFDVIVCFDVIEHAPNFKRILGLFNRWLKRDGLVFLTTPNIESWDAKLLKSKWYGFKKIPQHINFFSPASAKTVLERSGFKVKKIQTWGFVRSLDFVLKNMVGQNPFLATALRKIANFIKVADKNFYFPLIDMVIVAQKK